jgi:hypothetical protein
MGGNAPVYILDGTRRASPARSLCPDTDCPVWRQFAGLRERHDLLLRALRWVSLICVGAGVVVWLMRESDG